MRVAVTGSTCAIASHVVAGLSSAGYTVIETGGSTSNIWRLGQEFPLGLDADALIHLAHDRSLTVKQNIQAASLLCTSFKGPKIFLSSFSAHSKSLSRYGKSKFAMEDLFNKSNGASIRAGVVYGNQVGGIFEQLENFIAKLPIIPVILRGHPLLFTSHIDDLVFEILSKLRAVDGQTTFAAHPKPITLKNLCIEISHSGGFQKPFLFIPKQPIDSIARLLIRVIPNFQLMDSLLSMSCEVSYGELSKLKVPETTFRPFSLSSKN
jgi:nucleoside-diphosphate-sugar epimerase